MGRLRCRLERVEADQQVGDPGQGEHDPGPVHGRSGQAVSGRDQSVAPQHLQLALAAAAQQPVQFGGGQRPLAVDQNDDVSGFEFGRLVRRRHAQSAVGRLRREADRLKRGDLAADREPAQADHQDGQQQQRRGQAEPGRSGLDAHRDSACRGVWLLRLRRGPSLPFEGPIQHVASMCCATRNRPLALDSRTVQARRRRRGFNLLVAKRFLEWRRPDGGPAFPASCDRRRRPSAGGCVVRKRTRRPAHPENGCEVLRDALLQFGMRPQRRHVIRM